MLSAFFLREGEDAIEHDHHENGDAQLWQSGDECQTARYPEQQGEEVHHLAQTAAPPGSGALRRKAIGSIFDQQPSRLLGG